MSGHHKRTIIITCEHAGNDVPKHLAKYFQGHEATRHTHRGWDPGAWEVAATLATALNVPLFGTFVSRLVIEANRSRESRELFSEFTNGISKDEKEQLLQDYYLPYRTNVESVIRHQSKPVTHLSIHSFTPVWNGTVRDVDIGLLFDPARKNELEFCGQLQIVLQKENPALAIKHNAPYKGTDDGFTTYLRTRFDDSDYLGIEVEINQTFFENGKLPMIEEALLNALNHS